MMSRIRGLSWGYLSWLGILALAVAGGAVGALIVFTQGLAVTNLNDLVPWGLWITVDLSAIALSAGAFSLCALVYLLDWERFKPLAKTATFIGLLGYTMAVVTLLLDIGRPDRFWHPMVFWNTHSVLWEVTMCVMLYLGVLALETAPLVGEASWFKSRWPRVADRLHDLHKLAPILAIAGLGLSMLHQSSLGATYGVLKARPVWYRPGLAVLFIVSAVAGGMALTGLASSLAGQLSRRAKVDEALIEQLAKLVGFVLLAYLYLRFWDLFAMSYTSQPGRDEGLALLISGQLSFNFWMLEILLGAVIPVALLLVGRWRQQREIRWLAFALIVLGVIAYRWDTTLVGQLVVLSYLPGELTTAYVSYQPSFIEYLVTIGVVAFGFLGFTLGVRHLRVVEHPTGSTAMQAAAREALPVASGAD
ncbi:MAG: NrfD/PsrC family molybdoenzyme membrane anchor subunit [Anaerolineales bacterium]